MGSARVRPPRLALAGDELAACRRGHRRRPRRAGQGMSERAESAVDLPEAGRCDHRGECSERASEARRASRAVRRLPRGRSVDRRGGRPGLPAQLARRRRGLRGRGGRRGGGARRQANPAGSPRFLDDYAARIDARAPAPRRLAARETGLPVEPRLRSVSRSPAPRDSSARPPRPRATASFAHPVIDTKAGIRSCFGPLGKPVLVFGPNNFPFAFNAVAGGDLRRGAGRPESGHRQGAPRPPGRPRRRSPSTPRAALAAAGLPPATVQLLYRRAAGELGLRLVRATRASAPSAFTGSRARGARAQGRRRRRRRSRSTSRCRASTRSSSSPARSPSAATRSPSELTASCQLGAGQFCTNPGLVVVTNRRPRPRSAALVGGRAPLRRKPRRRCSSAAASATASRGAWPSSTAAGATRRRRRRRGPTARASASGPRSSPRRGSAFPPRPRRSSARPSARPAWSSSRRTPTPMLAIADRARGQPDRDAVQRVRRARRGRSTARSRAVAPPARRPAPRRQDADRRRREPRR